MAKNHGLNHTAHMLTSTLRHRASFFENLTAANRRQL
jgi:hypothetical protein